MKEHGRGRVMLENTSMKSRIRAAAFMLSSEKGMDFT